jgi:hypothetical protein
MQMGSHLQCLSNAEHLIRVHDLHQWQPLLIANKHKTHMRYVHELAKPEKEYPATKRVPAALLCQSNMQMGSHLQCLSNNKILK